MIHMITGEYPPTPGGVADYTAEVSAALVRARVPVHVWCPGDAPAETMERGVSVHRVLGALSAVGLERAGAMLDMYVAPRRLLVQWVPHAFGQRALNVGFCRWLSSRARKGDHVEIVVHEPFLPLALRLRHLAAAIVQRAMTAILLRAASRVWVVTPAWEASWRPYSFGRSVPFTWLPEPASIPVTGDAAAATAVRARIGPAGTMIAGAFSCGGGFASRVLGSVAPAVLDHHPPSTLLLIGAGSTVTRDRIVAQDPSLAERVRATGALDGAAVSAHLAACDLVVQPYPDGICTRHSSAMTVLAHGVPMVTTAGVFTEPVWRESGAVILAPAGDADALVAATGRLLAEPDCRAALRRRALALYDARFDVRHTAATLMAVGAR